MADFEDLVLHYHSQVDLESATFYAQLNFDLSPSLHSLSLLANSIVFEGNYLKAFYLLKTKSETFFECIEKESAETVKEIVFVYLKCCVNLGQVSEGIMFYEKNKSVLKNLGDRMDQGRIFKELSILYRILGNIKKSSKCIEKGHKIDPLSWSSIINLHKNQKKSRTKLDGVKFKGNLNSKTDDEKENIKRSRLENYRSTEKWICHKKPICDISNHLRGTKLFEVILKFTDCDYFLTKFDAEKAFRLLRQLPKCSVWVQFKLATLYSNLGMYEKAAKTFGNLEETAPYYFEALDLYSTTLWQLKQKEKLIVLSAKLFEISKSHTVREFWVVEANNKSLSKKPEKAVDYLQEAILLDPNYEYAYTFMGFELLELQQFEKAGKCFRKSLELNPSSFRAWYGLGWLESSLENHKEARKYFRKAVKINPKNLGMQIHFALSFSETGEKQKALNLLYKLDKKNHLVQFNIAKISFEMGDLETSERIVQNLQSFNENEELVVQLAKKIQSRKLKKKSVLNDIKKSSSPASP